MARALFAKKVRICIHFARNLKNGQNPNNYIQNMKACLFPWIFFSVATAAPLFNQLGYTPEAQKQIVIPGNDANPLEVYDLQGKRVLKLDAPLVWDWEYSGEETQVFDISSIKIPGTYRLYRGGEFVGNPLVIAKKPYEEISKAALKWFYFQRSGMALEAEYAGKWARAAGHHDNKVVIYGTDAETGGKGAGRTISSRCGWYDAGDYGKYVVNSGITVWTLLELYRQFPHYMDTLSWNIPRHQKKWPLLLEEIRYNLDWMLSMQAEDGGVYHKVTTLKFSGSVMPDKDTAKRYAIIKNVTASLNFAGVMALASVIYAPFDLAFSQKARQAAEKAYAWAKKNPQEFYKQPANVNTGSYMPKDEDGRDEFRFASAELYLATAKQTYLDDLKENPFTRNGAWWGDLNMLSVFRVAENPNLFGKELSSSARTILLEEANALRAIGDSSAYRLPMHSWNWNWGSNSAVANNGILLLQAFLLTKDKNYLNAAQQTLDYLLGRNPLNITYVTGFGYRSPKNPHHRISEADFVDEPIPGMLVGGPHLGKQDIDLTGKEHWKCPNYASANLPALAYLDDDCSYATNEVAINWNAPLAYLTAALQAIYDKNF